ncbi:MAG: sugar kinase, partial [Planctomycetes bacterium]|nr:sugar kinase [Planctomycetota bacterium]
MEIKPKADCRCDLIALGEVMLRLDPEDDRIRSARSFRVHEGGAEYNVARNLARVFGHRTALLSALVDNEIGRLLESLMLEGGVDLEHLRWLPFDGIGRAARNALNFTERGFGPRALLGVSDRAHSAASQLAPGAFDPALLFQQRGARLFHTGAIFAALSPTTATLSSELLRAARAAGTRTSFDLNYRASLWQDRGGRDAARAQNRSLVRDVEILFGGLEDLRFLCAAEAETQENDPALELARILPRLREHAPSLQVVAATLTRTHSASRQQIGGLLATNGDLHHLPLRDVEVLDRVGSGDAFAAAVL